MYTVKLPAKLFTFSFAVIVTFYFLRVALAEITNIMVNRNGPSGHPCLIHNLIIIIIIK